MATCLPNLSRLFHRPRPAAPSSASSAQATAAYRPRIETFTYATAATSSGGGVEGGGKDGMKLRVDAYLPQQQPQKQQPGWPPPPPRPAVLFFHPGELLFGARADVLRALCEETTKSYTLLSYTTRALVPATAHDIVADLTAAYAHYHTVLVPRLGLSATNVFVCGVGTGVYVALLAAAHWEPKPLGVVGVVPRGCLFLGAATAEPGAEPGPGEPPGVGLDAGGTTGLSPAADVPSSHRDYARRVALAATVARRRERLDLLTGLPGLAARLHAHRSCSAEELEKMVPEAARAVLPELLIDETFPPVYLVCGGGDGGGDEGAPGDRTLQESRALVRRLRSRMVLAQLVVADGVSHDQLCRGDIAVCRAPLAGVLPWLQQRCVADEGDEEGDDEGPV